MNLRHLVVRDEINALKSHVDAVTANQIQHYPSVESILEAAHTSWKDFIITQEIDALEKTPQAVVFKYLGTVHPSIDLNFVKIGTQLSEEKFQHMITILNVRVELFNELGYKESPVPGGFYFFEEVPSEMFLLIFTHLNSDEERMQFLRDVLIGYIMRSVKRNPSFHMLIHQLLQFAPKTFFGLLECLSVDGYRYIFYRKDYVFSRLDFVVHTSNALKEKPASTVALEHMLTVIDLTTAVDIFDFEKDNPLELVDFIERAVERQSALGDLYLQERFTPKKPFNRISTEAD